MTDKEVPEGITFIEDSYRVQGPWKLGHTVADMEEHGFRYSQPLNILYSAFIPLRAGGQPCLEMKHELPFWRLEGDAWGLFKRRAIGFSRKFPRLPDIADRSLDDLKDRLTGDWHG